VAARPIHIARSGSPEASGTGHATEPPLPTLELGDRRHQVLAGKVGPVDVDEAELGVRRLPQQEVGEPLLAGGADQEVGIREVAGVQEAGEGALVDGMDRQPARGAARRWAALTISARPP